MLSASMAVTVLTSLGSQTAGNGIGLWAPTPTCAAAEDPTGRGIFSVDFRWPCRLRRASLFLLYGGRKSAGGHRASYSAREERSA
jgi:hypothetical protein